MLASITPLGERGRGSTWSFTIAAFALGATAGGLVLGGLAGAAGTLLPPTLGGHGRLAVLAAALGVAAALDARASTAPGPRRQVNERWLDQYRGWVYGLGFGTQLGLGLTTVITSAATYAALVAAALSGAPDRGALIGGCFGLVRGLTPLVAAGVRTPPQLLALHRRMLRWAAPSRWATVAMLAGAAGAALGAALA